MTHTPEQPGLYEPATEHDACGVGFIVNIKGQKSREIVDNALTMLKNLLHRGACGCEENTGDGVGILIQKPDRFFRRVCAEIGIDLPAQDSYGAGLVFLPVDPGEAQHCRPTPHRSAPARGRTSPPFNRSLSAGTRPLTRPRSSASSM